MTRSDADSASDSLGSSADFSWHTTQLIRAVTCAAVRLLNVPANSNSVNRSSSALFYIAHTPLCITSCHSLQVTNCIVMATDLMYNSNVVMLLNWIQTCWTTCEYQSSIWEGAPTCWFHTPHDPSFQWHLKQWHSPAVSRLACGTWVRPFVRASVSFLAPPSAPSSPSPTVNNTIHHIIAV